jgi:Tetratricopeptide repeat
MRRHLGGMLVAGGLWVAVAGYAQSPPASPAPCKVAPEPVPCAATPAKPSPADPFAFPEAGSGSSSSPAPSVAAPGTPSTPADANPAKKSTAADFPFPDEVKPGSSTAPDSSSGSSSSSSSSSSSNNDFPVDPNPAPDAAGLNDKGSEGSQTPQGRHLLHRLNPVGTKLLTPEEREAEDLDIAQFYTHTGDLQGAYLRSQDAVKMVPDDPDAHFALAEIALKLNKRDEAINEYTAVLKFDPSDKQAKAARKELARLKPE